MLTSTPKSGDLCVCTEPDLGDRTVLVICLNPRRSMKYWTVIFVSPDYPDPWIADITEDFLMDNFEPIFRMGV